MTTHEQIISAFDAYVAENENFKQKNVKAAAPRARKALAELGKLAKIRRAEIQKRKTASVNFLTFQCRVYSGPAAVPSRRISATPWNPPMVCVFMMA